MLDAVRRRAGAIRRARRARLSAALGCVAAVLMVATALARTGEDPSSELQVVGPASTTTTSVAVTTTGPAMTTIVGGAAETTTTGVPATVPPTTRTVPPTTEAPAAPATTQAPASTTTTRPSPGACDTAAIVVTATTDRTTYAMGDVVTVTAEAVNRGSRPCAPADPSLEFFTPAGRSVGGMATADRFTMPTPSDPYPTWDPGEVFSGRYQWPSACQSDACSLGQYTVVVTFGGMFRSAPAPFTVTGP